jgi:hypothetical protein
MSPLHEKHDYQAEDADARAEIERLHSLPLEQLAADVTARGFTHDDSPDGGRISVRAMAQRMVPGAVRLSQQEIWGLDGLVGEGVQLLEHAALAQAIVVGTDRTLQWVLTRRGRAAVANGSIAAALARVASCLAVESSD